MASKCFCDACGAEMPATGSRTIEVRVALKNDPGPKFVVDGRRSDDLDICERCICKAFAARLDEPKPAPMHIPYAEQERIGTIEKMVPRKPPDAQMHAAWCTANNNLEKRGLPPIDGVVFDAIAGALPFGVPAARDRKWLAREPTAAMLARGVKNVNVTTGMQILNTFRAVWTEMYDAA